VRYGGSRSKLLKVGAPAFARTALAAGAAIVALSVGVSTNALADVFRFQPILILEQLFTDNVNSEAEDRDADGVTILSARAQMSFVMPKFQAAAVVDASYYEFWGTNEFDSFSGAGTAAARLEVMKDHVYINALAERSQFYQQPEDDSGAGFVEILGAQQTSYQVGPNIETDVLGLVDLTLLGRYAQTYFDDPVVDGLGNTLEDISIKNAAGRVTTGERLRLFELAASAEYIETDIGFEQRNVIGSVIFNVTKSFEAIGRIGYERTEDPTITTIKGTVWSAGGRYTIGEDSVIHVEYGRRFEDVSWLGDFTLVLTPKLTVSGTYEDSLTPAQFTFARSFSELISDDGTLDVGFPSEPELADPLIIDQIVRDRDLNASAIFVDGLQSVTLTGRHIDRFFPSLAASEKAYGFDVIFEERLSRRLTYTLNFTYEDGYERILANPAFKTYEPSIEFTYVYNSQITFSGEYAYRLFTEDGATDTHENVIRVRVARAL
jgi:hypothetical protein